MMGKAISANNYHYNPRLKLFARQLRNNATKAEACLWKYLLRASGFQGYAFRRQRPVLKYIADFMCFELMLIIEVDGITHECEDQYQRDLRRQYDLESVGFTVLRFSDWEVLHRMADVDEMLMAWLELYRAR